jgi:hypothetical protein
MEGGFGEVVSRGVLYVGIVEHQKAEGSERVPEGARGVQFVELRCTEFGGA